MAPRTKPEPPPVDDVLAGVNDDATEPEADDRPWFVKSQDGRRIFFEGTEADARAYVERNFPHIHAEPGNQYDGDPEPDVYLHSPDRVQHGYAGGEWNEYDDDE
jgi:hypothetical protein